MVALTQRYDGLPFLEPGPVHQDRAFSTFLCKSTPDKRCTKCDTLPETNSKLPLKIGHLGDSHLLKWSELWCENDRSWQNKFTHLNHLKAWVFKGIVVYSIFWGDLAWELHIAGSMSRWQPWNLQMEANDSTMQIPSLYVYFEFLECNPCWIFMAISPQKIYPQKVGGFSTGFFGSSAFPAPGQGSLYPDDRERNHHSYLSRKGELPHDEPWCTQKMLRTCRHLNVDM